MIILEDYKKAKNDILVDLRERINSFIQKVDHDFGLKNYQHIMDNVKDERVKEIYRALGPFDHFEYYDKDTEIESDRDLRLDFNQRKSGAMYRGQINMESQRPDGMGIKIFPNNSIFEGRFEDGKIHGHGRGITSHGEIYQGGFYNDMMQGEGLFQWLDGRTYYGKFENGKKHGSGIYMWPNGQTYVGDFKLDEFQGDGTIHYPDGKIFKGQFVAGKKNGVCYY